MIDLADRFTFEGLKYTTDAIIDINEKFSTEIKLRIVYNKFHERKTSAKEFLGQLYGHSDYKKMMFETVIKESVELTNAINQKTSIFESNRNSDIRKDLDSFAKEVLGLDKLSIQ